MKEIKFIKIGEISEVERSILMNGGFVGVGLQRNLGKKMQEFMRKSDFTNVNVNTECMEFFILLPKV